MDLLILYILNLHIIGILRAMGHRMEDGSMRVVIMDLIMDVRKLMGGRMRPLGLLGWDLGLGDTRLKVESEDCIDRNLLGRARMKQLESGKVDGAWVL